MQGPENFLNAQALAFRCPVDPARRAVIDSLTRVELNHDIFYCSSAAAARRFRATPLRYVHVLSDPVTHARFPVRDTSPHLRFHDRAYFFANQTMRRTFASHPDSFAVRRAGMMQ